MFQNQQHHSVVLIYNKVPVLWLGLSGKSRPDLLFKLILTTRQFWQPLALQYGKRPVYLISILATLAIQVWAPHTKTNGQWIANKILQGFFGAPIESLCEISVVDIYFTHERGRYIALYGLFLAGSNFFAPIIAGG